MSILMVLSVISLGGIELGSIEANAAAEKVVFFRKGGNGDGLSADSPTGSLTSAYGLLGEQGGRLVLCGDYTMPGGFVEPVHTGVITVTQNYNDIDYREEGALRTGGTARRYVLNGPTVFENIRFATTNEAGILIIAQYNPVELGEGVICEGFKGTLVANSLSVIGGNQKDLAPKKVNNTDSDIKIKSGSGILVVGLNRQIDETIDRNANIEISGGEISMLYGGCVNAGKGKSAVITINGGEFTGKLSCEYGLSDSVKVSVLGGDFSSCSIITGTAINSEISVAKNVESAVTPILSGFKSVTTSEGVKVNKVPEEVFGANTFTSADGTTLPYRYYYPEGYESSSDKYPIFVYFHGNGSRGTDNKTQLGATHALVNKVLNYSEDCVIIAPQAPKTSAWILDSEYPGGTGFDNTTEPKSKYLSAAIELVNTILKDEKIDRSRLYIGGSSNGAAACWSLISRNPRSVAGAVILAGTGSVGAADKIAPAYLYTPIWTFHGDADKTLSVEGTRGIVNAVSALGGSSIKYEEIPGRGHDIWVDCANTQGLYEWLFSQQRKGETPLLSATLDAALLDADYGKDAELDAVEGDALTTDVDTIVTQENASDTEQGGKDNGAGSALPIGIAAAVIALALVAVIVVVKKKKK